MKINLPGRESNPGDTHHYTTEEFAWAKLKLLALLY